MNGVNSLGWVIGRANPKEYVLREFPEIDENEKAVIADVIEAFRKSERRPSRQNIKNCLRQHCIDNIVALEKGQKKRMLHILEHAIFGFGPLDELLADGLIEEIALIGIEKPVYVFQKGEGWRETNLFFESERAVCNLVNRLSQDIGRRLSFQSPSINAVLPNGSRLHAAIKPVAFSGPCFTIRKFSKELFTPVQLAKIGTVSAEALAFIWMALESGCSLVVAGNTGSGKTTTLNALFSFVPGNERIVVVEETPEISLPHRHIVKLNVVEEQKVGMQKLIISTLRMRPDRVVVGEVRDATEMKAFVDTLLAGQGKGSYATFHSQSSEEFVKRAITFGISPEDLSTIDLVIVQRRWDRVCNGKRLEQRHVTEISELLEGKKGLYCNRLFEFEFGGQKLNKVGKSRRVAEKIEKCFSLSGSRMEKEIAQRAGFLRNAETNISQGEFFAIVNKWQERPKK